MSYDFPYIGNFIIPTDFHIFAEGLNHQPDLQHQSPVRSGDRRTGRWDGAYHLGASTTGAQKRELRALATWCQCLVNGFMRTWTFRLRASKFAKILRSSIPHRIHVWYIYVYIYMLTFLGCIDGIHITIAAPWIQQGYWIPSLFGPPLGIPWSTYRIHSGEDFDQKHVPGTGFRSAVPYP